MTADRYGACDGQPDNRIAACANCGYQPCCYSDMHVHVFSCPARPRMPREEASLLWIDALTLLCAMAVAVAVAVTMHEWW